MNCTEKELIEKKDYLLKQYDKLFVECLKYARDLNTLNESLESRSLDQLNWFYFINTDEEMAKITRLIAALSYVEMPGDKEVVDNLKENIAITVEENKRRK